MRGGIIFEILKKHMCLNVRFICIETREKKICEDPSTLTYDLLRAQNLGGPLGQRSKQ